MPTSTPQWRLEFCKDCDYPVTLEAGETLQDHIEKVHPGAKDPGYEIIENFQYDPDFDDPDVADVGVLKKDFTYDDTFDNILNKTLDMNPQFQGDEHTVMNVLDKIFDRLKNKSVEDAARELTNEVLDFYLQQQGWPVDEDEEDIGSEKDDFFKDCPHCKGEMVFWDGSSEIGADFPDYWFCEECGYGEEVKDQSKSNFKQWQTTLPYAEIDFKLDEYNRRKDLQFDKITDQVFLGDIVNGWMMRDRQKSPFDAILNVSQNTYTPPKGVEYTHIPLDEYSLGYQVGKKREQDLRRAIDQLKNWTEEGKKVYVHCTAGMNRSPSVVVGYLMESLGLGYENAVKFVNRRRPVAWPSGAIDAALRVVENVPAEERLDLLQKWRAYDEKTPIPQRTVQDTVKRFLKKIIPNPTWYSGEKNLTQTHPKFPPPGGVSKKPLRRNQSTFVSPRILTAAFNKIAIDREGLMNFYLIMQLPPEFFQDLPKWNTYAEGVVNRVAKEYGEWLEKLVRTEAHHTYRQLGYHENRDEDEPYCEHEDGWEEYDDDHHKCTNCGELDVHDWEEYDEEHHSCQMACGAVGHHEFDSDHDCGICNFTGEHTWVVSGDQEYWCEGCDSTSETLEEDKEAPFFGDFTEQTHEHEWTILDNDQFVNWAYAAKCFQCGRVSVWNAEENVQHELFPPASTGQLDVLSPFTYQDLLKKKKKKQVQEYQKMPKHEPYIEEEEEPMPTAVSVLRELRKFALGEHEMLMLGPGARGGTKFPGLTMDTGRWFPTLKIYPEGQKTWMSYGDYKKLFGPKETQVYDKMLIENPWAAAGDVDQEAIKWFEYARNLKWMLKNMTPEKIREMQKAIRGLQHKQQGTVPPGGQMSLIKPKPWEGLEFGVIKNFIGTVGVGQLFNIDDPGSYAKLTWEEIGGELARAWDVYTDELAQQDTERGEFYKQMDVPSPDWVSKVQIDLDPIGKGQAIGSKSASGPAVFGAEDAAGKTGFILVKTETTPEDLKLMTAANGFLMASGGPTSHAAIVARQMGKACIVSAGFFIGEAGAQFPNGAIIAPGDNITISSDGQVYGGTSAKTRQVDPDAIDEEKNVDEASQTYQEIVDMEEKLLGSKTHMTVSNMDFDDDPLSDVARAFNQSLKAGQYGGPLWALAAVRAIQVQRAQSFGLPWRYSGMLVDQVNTLQHNTGNIFENKPWPGHPETFIEEVLDLKASDHGLQWIAESPLLTSESRQMLQDFERWMKMKNQPRESFFGEDIRNLPQGEKENLKWREMSDVRQRRKIEQKELKHKWKYAVLERPIVVWGKNGEYTAMHIATKSSCSISLLNGEWKIEQLYIPDQWQKKGLLRRFFDVMAEADLGNDESVE